jgi:hypothetical protein
VKKGSSFRTVRATSNQEKWLSEPIHDAKQLAYCNGNFGREMATAMKTGTQRRKALERSFFAIAAGLPVRNPIRPVHNQREMAEYNGKIGPGLANIMKAGTERQKRLEEVFFTIARSLSNGYRF